MRDTHLHAARDQLKKVDGYLVVTVENSPFLLGATASVWQPPEASAVVRAYVSRHRAQDTDGLLALAPVRDFLARGTISPPRRPSSRRRWRVMTAARRPRPGSRSSGRRPWSSSAGSG
ncbi:hypothetical protein O1M63_31075 [Streptomyces mirabilis]|nr:hypothetical protein [Streptomyces mirabilis]